MDERSGSTDFSDLFHKHQLSNHEMNTPDNLSVLFDEYVKDVKMWVEIFRLPESR